MAKLKITRTDGTTLDAEITLSAEYAFEQHFKKGFYKKFREDELQSDVFWLAWELTRASGQDVPVFGLAFVDTLKVVDIDWSDQPLT